MKLVKSEENKADALTRVRKRWLVPEMGMGCAALEEVKKMHNEHHMGVERAWYWQNVWINQPKDSQGCGEAASAVSVNRSCASITYTR